MQKTIKHTLHYNHAPQHVWEYLTRPEFLEQWLMKTDFQPMEGRDFQFWTKPLPQFCFDGNIYCKVLEIIPFKKLSYSWKGGPGDGTFTLDSVVVWTLDAKDNGTELVLEHSGFKAEENAIMFQVMEAGWLKNMQRIGDLLNARQHDTAKP